MGIEGIDNLKPDLVPYVEKNGERKAVIKDGKRDKSLNTVAFNIKAKKRREKAKKDSVNRKKNQKR
jgi:hypothetical protein